MSTSEKENTQTIYLNAKKNLKDFKRLAKKNGIEFCLMDGTLLGAYRNGDFIADDVDDIDLGIMDADYNLDGLLEDLKAEGFEHFKTFEVDGKVEGCAVRRGGNHIDLLRINTDEHSYNLARKGDGFVAYTYPAISKFNKLKFNGSVYNIPANVEEFLKARYVDWKTPVNREDYDYLDQRQVPGLKEWTPTKNQL